PKLYWRFPGGDGTKAKSPLVPTSIACWGDDLYVPFHEPEASATEKGKQPSLTLPARKGGIACLSRKAKPGATPQPRWGYETPPVEPPPLVVDDLLLAVTGERSRGDLLAIDRNNGTKRWQRPGCAAAGNLKGRESITVERQHMLLQEDETLTCL